MNEISVKSSFTTTLSSVRSVRYICKVFSGFVKLKRPFKSNWEIFKRVRKSALKCFSSEFPLFSVTEVNPMTLICCGKGSDLWFLRT